MANIHGTIIANADRLERLMDENGCSKECLSDSNPIGHLHGGFIAEEVQKAV